ncbi:MAG: protein translocase subunit SecD [Micromonosporaceae bacterium]|nr:protein translocase subunit SecD [Micromonosporaceae bacterium]
MSRYFVALFIVIGLLGGLVWWTGVNTPKLGLDLQGGTSMTLSATANGKAPDQEKLEQAREIIENRVNDTGVAEPEVIVEGDRNIIINVAGARAEDLRKVGQPAELRFREVVGEPVDDIPASAASKGSPSASPSGSAKPSGSGKPKESDKPALDPSASASGSADPSGSPAASPSPTDKSVEELKKSAYKKIGRGDAKAGEALVGQVGQIQDPKEIANNQQAMQVLAVFSKLTGEEVATLPAQVQYKVPTITCKQLNERPPGSIRDAKAQVVACDTDGGAKYLMDKARVLGTDVKKADYGLDPQSSQWKVNLSFTGSGQDKWTQLTADTVQKRVAVVLDNEVVSAPTIQQRITGDAEITGDFSRSEAETLAAQLRYGALPLTFKEETTYQVTATLGLDQMRAGLLAGLIGLGLVAIYSFLYYRLLGFVVIFTLGAAGAIVYAAIVLLGMPWFGFTLTLAGIAGLIVAIGITADSFVVFFERIKDEVKDGRTVRSAVPRAWARARRTILSANTISIMAAAVLYLLAVGAVKGFAFTLGLATLIDLFLVFLFSHPLVALLSRSSSFTSPRVSGLGNLRPDPSERGGKVRGAVRTKES